METTDKVVIIGAGPVGLALALVLARDNISSTLYEARPTPTPDHESRAITFMPKGLEFLEWLGILQPFQDRGVVRYQHRFLDKHGRLLLTMRFDRLPGKYRYTLQLPQHWTERLLEQAACATGLVTIHRGHRLVALRQDDRHVAATLQTEQGEVEVNAPWLVGCDGARSQVREALGIRQKWQDYGTYSGVADFAMTCDLPGDISSIILDERRPYGFFYFAPGRWRLIYRINNGEDRAAMVSEARVTALLREKLPSVQVQQFLWASSFRLGQGQCETYYRGRCVLAGDAAHAMGPSAGAGMMVGLLGAWRLGGRLRIAYHQPERADALLQDYFREQRAGGRAVQRANRLIFANIALRNPLLARLRLAGLRLASRLPGVVDRMVRREALLDQAVGTSV